MAYAMTKQGSRANTMTYEFMCDTIADMNLIENEYKTLGSIAIVLQGESDGLEVYICNSSLQWTALNTGSAQPSGGSSGNSSLSIHVCAQNEIDNGLPDIASPDENTIYLVPAGNTSGNLYEEYIYVDDDWEKFGAASIDLSNYIQKTDIATQSTAGLVKVLDNGNVTFNEKNQLVLTLAGTAVVKTGQSDHPISVTHQHEAAFYGLAKAAGQDMKNSGNAVGTYTTEAASAIRTMIGAGTYIKPAGGIPAADLATGVIPDTSIYAPKASPVFTGSISLGRKANTTVGTRSSAIGNNVTASEYGSHAEGEKTVASAVYAHAEGSKTTAGGAYSHAEGNQTTTSASGSHAEGNNTIASGTASHAEGIYTNARGAYSHVEGCGGTGPNAEDRKMVSGINGYNMDAGAYSDYAHAEGYITRADMKAHSEGVNTYASGVASHAEGISTEAIGQGGHAEGDHTLSNGSTAHAEGSYTSASGFGAHAEGMGAQATVQGSHAEGYGTYAIDNSTHAITRRGPKATAMGSHAEGYSVTGKEVIASGKGSHVEGTGTKAEGDYSHAEGDDTHAVGKASHVGGKYNVVDSYDNWNAWTPATDYQVGDRVKYTSINTHETSGYICKTAHTSLTGFQDDKWDRDDHYTYVEIIGNGTADNARSNARALDWDGNEHLAGDLYVHCNNDSTGGNKVATEAYVNAAMPGIATNATAGTAKASSAFGIYVENEYLKLYPATSTDIRTGTDVFKPIVSDKEHEAVFYGLAKAAGDSTQAASDNAIGTYTADAKAAIQSMLDIAQLNLMPTPEKGQILYKGDTAVNSGHIVNALAYKDGVIIAARSDGNVVRIALDGTSTTLLTITGYLMDWRLMWMDSDENVYVSPHATRGSMTMSERGLYRLEKGANAFVKVISLYDTSSSVQTETEENNDTIWTMCEDVEGNLYAGVYAHSVRANPAIYKSIDGGVTWTYFFNFKTEGLTPDGMHIHCIVYDDNYEALYAIVGEINKIWVSRDNGEEWEDMGIELPYDKGSSMLVLPDSSILVGSDGAYNCAINIIYPDEKHYETVYHGWANTVFALRRSDLTGFIYAFCKIDSSALSQKYFPPYSVLSLSGAEQEAAIQAWRVSDANPVYTRWKDYHDSVKNWYPEDCIIPTHYAILVSRNGGRWFEVLKKYDSAESGPDGFWTVGQFINGEILAGHYKTDGGYVNPIIISEGKHKYVEGGCDLDGEIFIRTNSSDVAEVLPVQVEETITGNPATLKTNIRKPLTQLKISFEPIQVDGGDISGFSGVTVYQSGEDTSNPNVINVSFGSAGTVYNGTVDLVTGELTVTALIKEFDGTETWSAHGSTTSWFYTDNALTDPYINNSEDDFAICNSGYTQKSYAVSITTPDKKFLIGSPSGTSINRFVVKDTDYADVTAWTAHLAEHHLQVCYRIDTPLTYSISPTVINTLRGINKIWSNANGTMEIKYLKNE